MSRKQLLNAGVTDREIRALIGLGWRRPRRGWYAHPRAEKRVVDAVAAGGALTCVSALERLGVWVPPTDRIHVRYATDSRKKRVIRCQPYRTNPALDAAVDDLAVAVDIAANCLAAEDLIVVLDSLLNRQLMELADVAGVLRSSPHANRGLLEKCDGRAESGIETMVRLRLRARKIALRIQVPIGVIGRVDLLIGKSLIIECDGEEPHREAFEEDRVRDRRLQAIGYRVVRLTYKHVMYEWTAAEQDLLAIIRKRAHERPSTTAC